MATESVGIRFEAQDDASATTQKVAAAMRGLQADTSSLGSAAALARQSFVEFNAGLELSRKALFLIEGAVLSLPRALLSASEAAAGHKGFMEGLDESYHRVEVSIGKVVNSTGVLTDYFEGTRQIADTLATAISGSSVEAEGFRDAMQNLVIPAIQLTVSVGAAAIGGLAAVVRNMLAATTASMAGVAALLSKIPGADGLAKTAASGVADLALWTKSFDDIEKAAGRAATAVADLDLKFSGGTALPPPKPKAVTAKAPTSTYTREGEDARGAVDAYNERNKAIEEAQAAADARRAAMILAADTALGDARYAQRQAEVERMTQLEIAAEEERMRVSQSVQQQIAGFAQGTFDELGRGFARLVLTGKFGAKEFGAAMLGMTGQQAAARGALWLGEGLAMLFAGNPAGAAVAAQGAGLIALGGSLSAASSTLSGRAGGAAGAGASAASVPTFDRGTRRDDDRERSIVLNINTGGSADVEQSYHAHVLRRLVERGAVQAEGMRVNLA